MGGDTKTGARESSAFSRNLEAGPAAAIGRMGRDGARVPASRRRREGDHAAPGHPQV